MKKNLILCLIFVAAMAACIPSPPKPGFRISTTVTRFNAYFFPQTVAYPNAGINGRLVQPTPYLGPVSGTIPGFVGSTGPQAYMNVNGGVAPALWNGGFSPGSYCGGQTMFFNIFPGEDYGFDCFLIPIGGFFIATPSTIDVSSPPAFVTISGSGISSAGGMPTVEYYNSYGTLVAQEAASQVASDGTWLSASTPDLSSVSSGQYLLTIRNPDGAVAGNAYVDVFSYSEPPPDPEPGPCGPEMLCTVY